MTEWNDVQLRLMAAELAERHRIPKASVEHPKGVIVLGDLFMTEKISDPDYVPYCMPCTPMQRTRRVVDGFECPACGNKANWDLTKFNNNVDVQFDPELVDPVWLANWEEQKIDVGLQQEIDRIEHLLDSAGYGNDKPKYTINWGEDHGKKNTSIHNCGKCAQPFFGKKSRKLCRLCQESKPAPKVTLGGNPYEPQRNRRERRQGY